MLFLEALFILNFSNDLISKMERKSKSQKNAAKSLKQDVTQIERTQITKKVFDRIKKYSFFLLKKTNLMVRLFCLTFFHSSNDNKWWLPNNSHLFWLKK